ncbi:MotA/TolQ/ExbB proton channel family protein [Campylobacter ureolyticus]|uniref:MotA/TolQ/ExbB proton channel family protein n=1 Tax=Campylobacter ureolyticus TaxID=827 RepID=A0A9Q4KND9_9BACT|nr:MotA/TolQ/ExbB proton channel family protein [Campylobacter ureolyticus]MCZ6161280.1 MotA/TolQ/ExbB proton channel family protein [Campylobacter ureolyticus]MCZ6170436.1 MotA/TolQ/ExbB proton channel family protein [Campylobacter ureolyticus]
MESKNEISDEFNLLKESKRSLFGVYIKIVFIPVLVFLIFLSGYLNYISLKVESHSIIMLGFLLFIALIFARHNAEYGCCLFESRSAIFKDELKKYIMSHLTIIGNRKKSNSSFELFSDNFTNNLRNENYASVAAGVFPMLGILGTFISIAISMPHFSSTNINSLEAEIAQLLGGVGTAFYVSIYGIFLALWWIYFEKKGLSRFESIIYRYKNVTKNFFWEKDEISQSLMSEILNQNEKVANSFETVFNTEFTKNLRTAMKENFHTFEEMLELQKNSLKITSSNLNETISLFNNVGEISKNINQDFEKIINSFSKLVDDTNEIYVNLSKQLEKLLSFNDKKDGNLQNLANGLIDSLDKFKASLENFNKEFLNEQNETQNIFKQSVVKSVDEIKKVVDSLKKEKTANTDIVEELKISLDNIERKDSKK